MIVAKSVFEIISLSFFRLNILKSPILLYRLSASFVNSVMAIFPSYSSKAVFNKVCAILFPRNSLLMKRVLSHAYLKGFPSMIK
jgi:hypothetical protein